MYQPDHFRVDDVAQMHAPMRKRPFAALVSAGPAGLYDSHQPTVLKDEGELGVIECHASDTFQGLASAFSCCAVSSPT